MQIDRKCINCTSFPCMKEECAKDNVCSKHKFEHEKMIEENINHIPIIGETMILQYQNPYEITERKNKSSLQFNGDTYYTLYTETKFNKFQKFLWKHLLNIKISDVEE